MNFYLLYYPSLLQCQQLVFACSGWSIETIEHLGNRHDGYHRLQQSLAGFYGTQCGYCSPGMVMAAYGLVLMKYY